MPLIHFSSFYKGWTFWVPLLLYYFYYFFLYRLLLCHTGYYTNCTAYLIFVNCIIFTLPPNLGGGKPWDFWGRQKLLRSRHRTSGW